MEFDEGFILSGLRMPMEWSNPKILTVKGMFAFQYGSFWQNALFYPYFFWFRLFYSHVIYTKMCSFMNMPKCYLGLARSQWIPLKETCHWKGVAIYGAYVMLRQSVRRYGYEFVVAHLRFQFTIKRCMSNDGLESTFRLLGIMSASMKAIEYLNEHHYWSLRQSFSLKDVTILNQIDLQVFYIYIYICLIRK